MSSLIKMDSFNQSRYEKHTLYKVVELELYSFNAFSGYIQTGLHLSNV